MSTDKLYATVGWTPEDVQSLTDDEDCQPTITKEQALEFLVNNERHIQNRLVELGFEVIGDLMRYDGLLK